MVDADLNSKTNLPWGQNGTNHLVVHTPLRLCNRSLCLGDQRNRSQMLDQRIRSHRWWNTFLVVQFENRCQSLNIALHLAEHVEFWQSCFLTLGCKLRKTAEIRVWINLTINKRKEMLLFHWMFSHSLQTKLQHCCQNSLSFRNYILTVNLNIISHPSSYPFQCFVEGGAGAYPSCLRAI